MAEASSASAVAMARPTPAIRRKPQKNSGEPAIGKVLPSTRKRPTAVFVVQ